MTLGAASATAAFCFATSAIATRSGAYTFNNESSSTLWIINEIDVSPFEIVNGLVIDNNTNFVGIDGDVVISDIIFYSHAKANT
jgi:hypothetical protein